MSDLIYTLMPGTKVAVGCQETNAMIIGIIVAVQIYSATTFEYIVEWYDNGPQRSAFLSEAVYPLNNENYKLLGFDVYLDKENKKYNVVYARNN
jgi:hypothetical protein